MKNYLRWDNLTWPEIKQLSADQAIVLLPVGSTEQHGPHLPTGCDAILATAMCERAAAELKKRGFPAVVAPTFAVANSTHHMSFPGSMTLTPHTFLDALLEQCKCIAAHGFKKIALINGHGGNKDPIGVAQVMINEALGFPVWYMGYWAGSGAYTARVLETQSGMIHACEGETSLMLAINEDLVDPIYKQTSGNSSYGTDLEDDGVIHTFHRMEHMTDNGVMGNSNAASKEKGEKIVERMTQSLADILCRDDLWNQGV